MHNKSVLGIFCFGFSVNSNIVNVTRHYSFKLNFTSYVPFLFVRSIAKLRDIIQIPYDVAGFVKQLSIRTDIITGEGGHQIEKIDRFCSF